MSPLDLLKKWCPVGSIIGDEDFIQLKVLSINEEKCSFDAEIIVAHHCSWRKDCEYNADDYYEPGTTETWYHCSCNVWNTSGPWENTVMYIGDMSCEDYDYLELDGVSFGK